MVNETTAQETVRQAHDQDAKSNLCKEYGRDKKKIINIFLSDCALVASTTNRIAVQPPATNRIASATRNAGGGGVGKIANHKPVVAGKRVEGP